ncbi:MAG: hypothetical protein GY850_31980 [bacterium]|nr:hypothetical protein [bacterium]
MINAIAEATLQQFVRTSYNSEKFGKDQDIKKTNKIKKQRPVEGSEDGQKSEMSLQPQNNTTTRNSLEDGRIIVEKYDENGKLIKKTPPGLLPFGEMA